MNDRQIHKVEHRCSCGAQESTSTKAETRREWRCHLEHARGVRS